MFDGVRLPALDRNVSGPMDLLCGSILSCLMTLKRLDFALGLPGPIFLQALLFCLSALCEEGLYFS